MKSRAIVFAGQGAQCVGMGKDLAEAYPGCRALFDRASVVLGYDLAKLCFDGPLEELTRTDRCQPAVFVVSMACYAALRHQCPDLAVAGMAGLSLGEWTALHAAGAIEFEDAVRVLQARGRFMQEACDERKGGMVSVMGLPPAAIETVCESAGVQIANLNAPDQIVLSGPWEPIQEAERLAQVAGAKRTVVLTVAGAYHSALMASAAGKLERELAGVALRVPAVPVVANVTGQPHTGPDEIRRTMVRQVTSPVQWVADMQWFQKAGVAEYVECGPGRVLAGLIKRIDKDSVVHSIHDRPALERAVTAMRD